MTVQRSRVLVEARAATRGDALVPRCAWCDRLSLGGRWLSWREAPALPPGLGKRLTHSICPDCIAELKRTGRSA